MQQENGQEEFIFKECFLVLWILKKSSVLLYKYPKRLASVKEHIGDKRSHCYSHFKDSLERKTLLLSAFILQLELNPSQNNVQMEKERWSHSTCPLWKYSFAKSPLCARGPGGLTNRSLLQSCTSYHEQSAIPGVKLLSRLIKGKGKAASGLQYLAFSTQFNAV